MSELDEVITAGEAARIWGKDASTIKKRCQEGRWQSGEYRRAGKEWLILRSALVREYGDPKTISTETEKRC